MPQQLTLNHARVGGESSPKRRVRSIMVLFAGALVALLASSSSHLAVSGPTETRVIPPIYRMMYLSDDQNRRIAEAKDVLVADCMAAQGLSYTPPHVEDLTEDETLAALRPFGLESLDSITAVLPAEPVRGEQYALALFGDPAQRMVVRGERLEMSLPATGCQADAEHRLLGDRRQRASELRLLLYDGERDTMEQLDQDPAFVTANERWRTCANHLGFDAPTPTDLLGSLPDDADLMTDSAARADLQCKQETRYLHTAYARLAVLQQHWLDAHSDLMGEWLALRQRQHTVARQVFDSRRQARKVDRGDANIHHSRRPFP